MQNTAPQSFRAVCVVCKMTIRIIHRSKHDECSVSDQHKDNEQECCFVEMMFGRRKQVLEYKKQFNLHLGNETRHCFQFQDYFSMKTAALYVNTQLKGSLWFYFFALYKCLRLLKIFQRLKYLLFGLQDRSKATITRAVLLSLF